MNVLGIESSCDECSAAVVADGRTILSNVIASQIDIHRPYGGVVPEIASRTHTEWIVPVVRRAIETSGIAAAEIDGIAVTNRPGLIGSLLVGLSFAKGLAYSLGRPLVAVDHMLAHLYAPQLEATIAYPYLGLLVSGGHTILCRAAGFDDVEVFGTTIDDACGEAFDKVAKHYGLGFPGGVAIDRLSRTGDPRAFSFPVPWLHKGARPYDVSYSGLKTAVINQADQFWNRSFPKTNENIAASFQRAAVDLLVAKLERLIEDTGIRRVVAGGGVAANWYLRERIAKIANLEIFFPSLKLCTDNGAMVAGIGYQYLVRGDRSGLETTASSRVSRFRGE